MKYLKKYKLFERFEESDTQNVFEPYVNWDMIETLKDMSLEYLDDGMTLKLEIIYLNQFIAYDFDRSFYFMKYNHGKLNSSWNCTFDDLTEGPYELEPIKPNYITYKFYLIKIGEITVKSTHELRSRMKDAYPNENIWE